MPTSRPNAITHICNLILKTNPRKVLDIGVGHGKWGFLVREYTDVWCQRSVPYTVIHGIEIYKRYITPIHNLVYNDMFIGDVVDILSTLDRYDMVIWGDCIEHLTKENGIKILNILKDKHGVSVVTTPRKFIPQGEVFGNIHEKHVCLWTVKELQEFGLVYDLNGILVLEINS